MTEQEPKNLDPDDLKPGFRDWIRVIVVFTIGSGIAALFLWAFYDALGFEKFNGMSFDELGFGYLIGLSLVFFVGMVAVAYFSYVYVWGVLFDICAAMFESNIAYIQVILTLCFILLALITYKLFFP